MNIETIRQAFAPFAEALKANETDTIRRLAKTIAEMQHDPNGWYVCNDEASLECSKRLRAAGSLGVGTFLHNGHRITVSSDTESPGKYVGHISVSKDAKPADPGVATKYARMLHPNVERWTSEEVGKFSTHVYEVV